MKKIKLESRDNSDNYLEEISPHCYTLKTDLSYRTGSVNTEKGMIPFVDPSGGPFITEGFKFDDEVVTEIKFEDNKLLIYTEDDLSGDCPI